MQLLELASLLLLPLLDAGVGERTLVIERGAGVILALAGFGALFGPEVTAPVGDLLLGILHRAIALGQRLPGRGKIALFQSLTEFDPFRSVAGWFLHRP